MPYLTLYRLAAPQRERDLREVFNALRWWIVRIGAQWRMIPNHFPPWHAVYDQTRRWTEAGAFEAMVRDVRTLLPLGDERAPDPAAVVADARTLQRTSESGHRAGYNGNEHK